MLAATPRCVFVLAASSLVAAPAVYLEEQRDDRPGRAFSWWMPYGKLAGQDQGGRRRTLL